MLLVEITNDQCTHPEEIMLQIFTKNPNLYDLLWSLSNENFCF